MKLRSILRGAALAGIFAIPFVPLVVAQGFFFPYVTGKNFLFRIAVEVAFFSWIALAAMDAKYRPKRNVLLMSVAAFVAVIFLSDLLAVNPVKSFWSNFERMEGFVTIAHLFAFFAAATSVLSAEKLWRYFFDTTIAVSAIVAIYGLFQYFGFAGISQSTVRLDSTLGNATYLAVYMLINVFLALFLVLRAEAGSRQKWLYGIVIALEVFVLFNTATRGAVLGLVGGLLVTAAVLAFKEPKGSFLRKAAFGYMGVFLVLVGSFFALRAVPAAKEHPVIGRILSISLSDKTVRSRFMVWNMAWQGVKERPILGWGQESFNYVFNAKYDPGMYDQEQWFDRTHNVFMDWLIAGGVVGLAAYLSVFAAVLYLVWKRRSAFSNTERAVLTGLLAGYFFHNLFVFDNIVSYALFFSVAAYVSSRAEREANANVSASVRTVRTGAPYYAVAAVAAAVFAVTLWFVNVKPMRANADLVAAITNRSGSVNAEQLKSNLESFKKAIAGSPVGRQEAREQLFQIARAIWRSDAPGEIKKEWADYAISEIKAQLAETPDDARMEVFAGSFLNGIGRYREAIPHIERAISLSPKKQTMMFELGTSHLNLKEYDKALAVLKTAFELDPRYGEARNIYAAAAVFAGDYSLADKVLIEGYGTKYVDDPVIVRAYYEKGKYSYIVETGKMKVEQDPESVDARMFLATGYSLVGERAKAIAEVEKAIQIDPAFEEQGRFYIEEIKAGRQI